MRTGPTLIALETSTEIASAALLHRGELLWRETSGVHTHSQTILPMIQELLAEVGISMSQCDAIAFGIGPGSFTGVRTACGIGQGLAFGIQRPVLPVVTLMAMAEACRIESGSTEVLTLLDARMSEVYWAQYRYNQVWQVVQAPSLATAQSVRVEGEVVLCGNALDVYAAELTQFPGLPSSYAHCMPHARHVASLAHTSWLAGEAIDPYLAQPMYLRNKIALTTAEREVRSAG